MRISDWSSDVCSSDRPTTPRLQRATTTMPGRGQAPIAAAPIRPGPRARHPRKRQPKYPNADCPRRPHLNAQEPSLRSEEHTSELQSLMRISYAVFCLKKKQFFYLLFFFFFFFFYYYFLLSILFILSFT